VTRYKTTLVVVHKFFYLPPNEPTSHKSVDYRVFKRGFQASRNQSQSLYIALTK
jgi:hypothetical protein